MEYDVFGGREKIQMDVTPEIWVAINSRYYASVLTTLEQMGLILPGIKNSIPEKEKIKKAIRETTKANLRDFKSDDLSQQPGNAGQELERSVPEDGIDRPDIAKAGSSYSG